ncbi:MAG TPA: PP2C family protein-serine/threonine phosphatase [Thermoanaerobaculia bacterium]|nr:PP2C family protein-serine/threonine phosphatase [Thermoanaerobaculia bacterium]
MRRRLDAAIRAFVIGALAAIALLVMFAFSQPRVLDVRVLATAASAGGLFAALVGFLQPRGAKPMSRAKSIVYGLGYAAFGFWFWAVITVIAMLMTTPSEMQGCWPATVVLLAFGGLGTYIGNALYRFRIAEAERQRASVELEVARDLQQRLLPPRTFERDSFRITAKNVPAIYVAGDFYDFIELADGRVLIALCDVAGKGVAAGLIVASTKAVLPFFAAHDPSPHLVLLALNDKLARELARREFVAAVIALFDPATGVLEIANGGMPDPVIGARAIQVPGPRYPAGIRAGVEYESMHVTLAKGERVVFFSDGLPEAHISKREQVGYERVAEEIAKHDDVDALFSAIESIANGQRDDDWTAVMLRRL